VNRLAGLLDDTIVRLRRLYGDLVPIMLEDLGLAATIEWRLQTFGKETGIRAVPRRVRDVPFTAGRQALIMYRILQESLDNVARHAGAQSVVVDLESEGDEAVLRVSDDGSGLQTNGADSWGLGIPSMRARVESIGGELRVFCAGGCGTVVEARAPLRCQESPT